jgi:hypothetical protein
MITRFFILFFLLGLRQLNGQTLTSYFSDKPLPLVGQEKYFGMSDLKFFSDPKKIPTEKIDQLDPKSEYSYVDSVFNMETGEFISATKETLSYFGFYKVNFPAKSYGLLFSKSDKHDEYGYNVFLNVYTERGILKSSVRVYSSSEHYTYRTFKLTADSLTTVDYLPVKLTQIVNGKKKTVYTTNFQIFKYSFDTKKFQFAQKKSLERKGRFEPSKYKRASAPLEDDPIQF